MNTSQSEALEKLGQARERLFQAKARADRLEIDEETRRQVRSIADLAITQVDLVQQGLVEKYLKTLLKESL